MIYLSFKSCVITCREQLSKSLSCRALLERELEWQLAEAKRMIMAHLCAFGSRLSMNRSGSFDTEQYVRLWGGNAYHSSVGCEKTSFHERLHIPAPNFA